MIKNKINKNVYALPYDYALTLVVDQHVTVHLVGEAVDVRWILVRCLQNSSKIKPS